MSALLAFVSFVADVRAEPASVAVEPAASRARWSAGAEGGLVVPYTAPRLGAYGAFEWPFSDSFRLRLEPTFLAFWHAQEVGRYGFATFGSVREEREVIGMIGRVLTGYAVTPWLTGYAGAFVGIARGTLNSSGIDSPSCGSASRIGVPYGVALGAGARTSSIRGLELGALGELGRGFPILRCAPSLEPGEMPDPLYEDEGLFNLAVLARVGYSW